MNNKLSQELCHAYNGQEEHLQHHGIKNMHWGVKNGPPYPLDKKVSASIKAGKNEKARFTKKELEYMRKHPYSRKYKDKKVGIAHVVARNREPITNMNYFRFVKGFEYKKPMNVATLIGSGRGDAIKRLDRPGHKINTSDAVLCNQPNKGDYADERRNNCALCSATLALRSLGYDVMAGTTSLGSLNSSAEYWFDGARSYKSKGAANLYNQMSSFGNQGKGVLSIRHATGGGHAVYFQNERGIDGRVRPVIYDGQIGKRYDTVAQFLKAEHADMTQFSTVTRLDTATPNWKNLAEDSVCMLPSNKVPAVDRDRKTGEYLFKSDNDLSNRAPIHDYYSKFKVNGTEKALYNAYKTSKLWDY